MTFQDLGPIPGFSRPGKVTYSIPGLSMICMNPVPVKNLPGLLAQKFFTCQLPFLSLNQQCLLNKGNTINNKTYRQQ